MKELAIFRLVHITEVTGVVENARKRVLPFPLPRPTEAGLAQTPALDITSENRCL